MNKETLMEAKNEISVYFGEHPEILERYSKALIGFDEEELVNILVEVSKGLSSKTMAYTTLFCESLADTFNDRIREDEELYEKMKEVTNIYYDLEDEKYEEDEG